MGIKLKCFICISFFILTSCTSAHNVVPRVDYKKLVGKCQNKESEICIKSYAVIARDLQKKIFGGTVNSKIVPVLVLINNNSDFDFGISLENIEIILNDGYAIKYKESTGSFKGGTKSASSLVSFFAGTAAFGFVPGVLIASIAIQEETSVTTQVSVNMSNRKLESGVIHSGSDRVGFLYVYKDRINDLDKYFPGEIKIKFLNLETKKRTEAKSSVIAYQNSF